jgi:hypothetical protein
MVVLAYAATSRTPGASPSVVDWIDLVKGLQILITTA